MGASDFEQLRQLRVESAQIARSRSETELSDLSAEFVAEKEKQASIPQLQSKYVALREHITKSTADRLTLVSKSGGSAERLEQYNTVATALLARRSSYEQLERRKGALGVLADEVKLTRTRTIPDHLRQLRARHQAAALPEELWSRFALQFSGDVDQALVAEQERVERSMSLLLGVAVAASSEATISLIPPDHALNETPIATLQAEAPRLEKLVGLDRDAARSLSQLNSKIAADEAQAANIQRQIDAAKQAPARIKEIVTERAAAYANIFSALIAEQRELDRLYTPLGARIAAETGSAGKLSFNVCRRIDVRAWAEQGENLLDLRKGSILRRGLLADIAQRDLAPAWTTGDAETVSASMASFRSQYDAALVECCPFDASDPASATKIRHWAGEISAWLYNTSHIEITYGVQYDGIDVELLSPGTRGIVLLLLYLVIDIDDNRPLLIDQPEENLDPRSIFVELVDRFREAKRRRQIIIVTHNANLIVKTDADQVIVANCGAHRLDSLPDISYKSGSLEDPRVRNIVCEILEGGHDAFKERAKRLRVSF